MSDNRALLLDLDGTLADSLNVMRAVYGRFLGLFGYSGNEAEFAALNGPPLAHVVEALQKSRSLPGTTDALVERYRALLDEEYSQVRPAPGGEALLRKARAAGWATGVVTSGPSELARSWLAAVGFDDLVDVVVGGEMVARGKPHADPYIAALEALNAAPEHSLAVEDSEQGVTAAVAAGVRTFLYRPCGPDELTAEDDARLAGVVDQLDELADKVK